MEWYHGSPVGGLTELKPFLSEHGKPYLYFAEDPLVALLYAVKPVPKPLSFYPYGFAGDGGKMYRNSRFVSILQRTGKKGLVLSPSL